MQVSEAAERARLVDVARGWIRTPFHDCAGVKGVGVDCAQFLAAVFIEAGFVEPFTIAPYSPQFMLHRSDEIFMGTVLRFAKEIPAESVGAGDVVLYKIGRCFAHGAIVVDWPHRIIHAFKGFGCVAETHAFEAELRGRDVKFFSRW